MSYPSRFVEFWGPSTWKTLHSIAWSYAENENSPTEEEKKDIIDFFMILSKLLPCPSCRKHFSDYMLRHPIDASSRSALVRWLYDLHSDVNIRTKKTAPTPTFEEHRRDYAQWGPSEMTRFKNMDRRQQINNLSDPHFGRMKFESMTGAALDSPPLLFAAGGLFVAVLAFGVYRANNQEKNKK
jgi:hypothetical protein